MVIGYISVSKTGQNQNLQFDSLNKAGYEKFFMKVIRRFNTKAGIYKNDFGALDRGCYRGLEN